MVHHGRLQIARMRWLWLMLHVSVWCHLLLLLVLLEHLLLHCLLILLLLHRVCIAVPHAGIGRLHQRGEERSREERKSSERVQTARESICTKSTREDSEDSGGRVLVSATSIDLSLFCLCLRCCGALDSGSMLNRRDGRQARSSKWTEGVERAEGAHRSNRQRAHEPLLTRRSDSCWLARTTQHLKEPAQALVVEQDR